MSAEYIKLSKKRAEGTQRRYANTTLKRRLGFIPLVDLADCVNVSHRAVGSPHFNEQGEPLGFDPLITIMVGGLLDAPTVFVHFSKEDADFYGRQNIAALCKRFDGARVMVQGQFGVLHLGIVAAENCLGASVEHALLATVRALKRRDGVIARSVHFTKIEEGPSQTDA